ncbi:hypothetical protein [Hymenobacter sp. BT730]|uniref:hypothetical protein n=1 Tax=Hymenobacter sp. BT730 TaxID=3063332 RepID=UPI0026DF1155|nr:hypothetical protein [Hymenobacter sp. BT730]
MKQTILFICVLVSSACSIENKNEQALPAQTTLTKPKAEMDALIYISRLDSEETERLSAVVKQEHQLNTLMAHNDTVILVLENRALFFPLGKYPSLSAIRNQYLQLTHQVNGNEEISTDEMHISADTVKFIKTNEEAEVYIVAGRITGTSLKLANGVMVGMSKNDFLKQYFSHIPQLLVQGGQVIELVSALDGIKHYYTFRNQKLTAIEFTSDYVLD